jgi:hypothetical protein
MVEDTKTKFLYSNLAGKVNFNNLFAPTLEFFYYLLFYY